MKKFLTLIMLLIATSAFCNVDPVKIYNGGIFGCEIYKFTDGNNTCYTISGYKEFSISCVKN